MLKVSLGYFQRRPNNKTNDEVWSVTIRLASLPKSAMDKYHPDQLALYSKFSELMFKALNLSSVIKFMEGLAEALGLEYVEVLVNRKPAARSRADQELRGISLKDRPLIIVFPSLLQPSRLARPVWRIGIRGYILNSTIRAVIHEMLHQSGIHDEGEARRLTDQHYKSFRSAYLSRFEEEFKSILKEWKKAEKDFGLL